jgi:hypothetical protein
MIKAICVTEEYPICGELVTTHHIFNREKLPHEKAAEGYFITAAELEQREREAFEAGQESVHFDGAGSVDYYQTADDYLKERKES